jgi:hypothetical protein
MIMSYMFAFAESIESALREEWSYVYSCYGCEENLCSQKDHKCMNYGVVTGHSIPYTAVNQPYRVTQALAEFVHGTFARISAESVKPRFLKLAESCGYVVANESALSDKLYSLCQIELFGFIVHIIKQGYVKPKDRDADSRKLSYRRFLLVARIPFPGVKIMHGQAHELTQLVHKDVKVNLEKLTETLLRAPHAPNQLKRSRAPIIETTPVGVQRQNGVDESGIDSSLPWMAGVGDGMSAAVKVEPSVGDAAMTVLEEMQKTDVLIDLYPEPSTLVKKIPGPMRGGFTRPEVEEEEPTSGANRYGDLHLTREDGSCSCESPDGDCVDTQ